jgi:ABC-type nitrate/sulfonate/bicarbonate transport system substrate-binding protein
MACHSGSSATTPRPLWLTNSHKGYIELNLFRLRLHRRRSGRAFAVAEELLYGNPALAKKIVRAIVKGVRYEKAFKNETVAIVGKYQKPVAHPHASEVEYEYFMHASTRDLTFANDLIAADLAVRADLIGLPKDKIPPIEKIYDFTLARTINAELDAAHWKPSR